MILVIALIVLGLGVSAAVVEHEPDTCCFQLNALRSVSAPIWQLSDGSLRLGRDKPPSDFCLHKTDKALKDMVGRKCQNDTMGKFKCKHGLEGMPTPRIDKSLLRVSRRARFHERRLEPPVQQRGAILYVHFQQG